MINFWYFIPKSGVAFIFISVALIAFWNLYKTALDHPYFLIFSAELILFLICFFIADWESNNERNKKH
ncbi:MAG: hypothetical protein ABSD69_00345 [Candidatus Levyibacteriota bacterium]|jgi:hypothetical protein